VRDRSDEDAEAELHDRRHILRGGGFFAAAAPVD